MGLKGKRIVLSVGRLDPRKRIDTLIEAFAKVLVKFDDVVLIIVGSGSDEGRFTALVKGSSEGRASNCCRANKRRICRRYSKGAYDEDPTKIRSARVHLGKLLQKILNICERVVNGDKA